MEYTLIKSDRDDILKTSLTGQDLLSRPILNKGSAFSAKEREAFGLLGILPSHISTIEEQSKRMHEEIMRQQHPLDRFIILNALQNRNEVLFYKVLFDHLVELMPIVYTPTVGLACEQFSRIFTKVRGLWITPEHRGRIAEVLKNYPFQDIRLIVATDNERILGLGDLGAGGIGIPIGKLSLYTVAAGFHPIHTLPISLDVGTDNETLLSDPMYLGWKNRRLRGQPYYDFVDEFVDAVKTCFPKAILQWEDLKKQNAFTVLDAYAHALPSFNDDIQGTAAVALAGILSGCRITKKSFQDQRVLILGAGAAGVGISKLLKQRWIDEGASPASIQDKLLLVDSQGILTATSQDADAHKREFAWSLDHLKKHHLTPNATLPAIVRAFKPTVLIGTSGQPGAFSKEMIVEMGASNERPMVFPLSNPTSHSEAVPSDVMEWTNQRAIIATGSPFPDVSQGNNVYIYPAIGLSALILEARTITNSHFSSAAAALARLTREEDLQHLRLYPELSQLRSITLSIAEDVAVDHGMRRSAAQEAIRAFVWTPRYPTYVRDLDEIE